MYLIQSSGVVGSGGVGNVTFNNIPQHFERLQIRAFVRDAFTGSTNQSLSLQMNGDTGANYKVSRWYGTGGGTGVSPTSEAFINNGNMFQLYFPTNAELANVYGTGIIDISDYNSSTKFKVVMSMGGYDKNGGGAVGMSSGVWLNQNPITSLTVFASGNIMQYSSVALYGIGNPTQTGA